MTYTSARHPLLFSGLAEMRNSIKSGYISSCELLELHINQVERVNPALNAVVVKDFDNARKKAYEADKASKLGLEVGPLHGIPMTVKESYDVKGLPTTWGMERFRTNFANRSALVVERLVAAGAVIYGKTNVAEGLADWQTSNAVYGRTNNPWDVTRTPGGSSGGSAVAVASGMSPWNSEAILVAPYEIPLITAASYLTNRHTVLCPGWRDLSRN